MATAVPDGMVRCVKHHRAVVDGVVQVFHPGDLVDQAAALKAGLIRIEDIPSGRPPKPPRSTPPAKQKGPTRV